MSLLHTKLYLKSSESNNEQMRGCNSGPQCNFNHSQSALVFPIFSVFRLALLLLTHCPQQFGVRQHIYLTSLHLTFIWTFPQPFSYMILTFLKTVVPCLYCSCIFVLSDTLSDLQYTFPMRILQKWHHVFLLGLYPGLSYTFFSKTTTEFLLCYF